MSKTFKNIFCILIFIIFGLLLTLNILKQVGFNTGNDEPTSCSVGETVELNNQKVTFSKIEDYEREKDGYIILDNEDGKKYIRAYFIVENIGKKDQSVSSAYFKCYVDDTLSDTIYFLTESIFPTSTISSGKKAEGYVYFEIPENAENITIEYSRYINGDDGDKIIFNW